MISAMAAKTNGKNTQVRITRGPTMESKYEVLSNFGVRRKYEVTWEEPLPLPPCVFPKRQL